MERKIGETFELEGTTLRVTEVKEHTCEGCFLIEECYNERRKVAGKCFDRTDKKNVIFTEVEKATEQPAPEGEQKLNLLEILKNCPRDTELWTPLLGYVIFKGISEGGKVLTYWKKGEHYHSFEADGTIFWGYRLHSTECMLFPSKEQRDWSKVEYKQPIDKLPKSWQEFCETHEVQEGEAYIDDCCNLLGEEKTGDTRDTYNDMNILPSKQACLQHLALMQLHQLRDAWREGWLPDWKDGEQKKYVIVPNEGESKIYEYHTISRFLAFQDEKRADEFNDCFIDLIRKAGDLI